MIKHIPLLVLLGLVPLGFADNQVFITQSGTNAQIEIDQAGANNSVKGNETPSGTPVSDLKLTGNNQTIDIDQVGASNSFVGDIVSDSFTGNFEFVGSTNAFNIQFDPAASYDSDNITMDVDVDGSNNTFTVNVANNASAAGLDYDAVISGDYNVWVTDLDSDNITFNVDVNGSNTTLDYDASGYASGSTGHTFILDQDGSYIDYTIDQLSTSAVDYLNLQMTTAGTSSFDARVCVYQSDSASATSC
jgi:hypothetical protein